MQTIQGDTRIHTYIKVLVRSLMYCCQIFLYKLYRYSEFMSSKRNQFQENYHGLWECAWRPVQNRGIEVVLKERAGIGGRRFEYTNFIKQ